MNEQPEITAIVRGWVEKAENDLRNAEYVLGMEQDCPTDTVCFHCQQAGEKLLKAVLQDSGIRFGKTHDLEEILSLCTETAPELALLLDDVTLLGDYAVRYRNPGMRATRTQARSAMKAARRIRTAVLGLLKPRRR